MFTMETGDLTADTWTYVTKAIPGASNLVFNCDNGQGWTVQFIPFYGTNFSASDAVLNTWKSSDGKIKPTTDNWITSNNAYMDITGVQLEVADTATDFEHRSYQEELQRCWRYFYLLRSSCLNTGRGSGSSACNFTIITPVNMRTTPSITLTAGSGMRHYGIDSHSDSTTAPTVVAWRDTSNHILCDQGGHSGVNDDRVLTLMPNGSASEGIELSAEL